MGDLVLEPFASMYAVDRSQYGFSPIPNAGPVSITGKSFFASEAMLHFSGNPSRTISFRWDGKAYQWLSEQEKFEGPRMWDTDDGRRHEWITIDFHKEASSTWAFQGHSIYYFGPEGPNFSLKLADAEPLLKKWGFRK